MIAKGKDCADLFPAVVKNVVSKNSEVSTVCVSSVCELKGYCDAIFRGT